jgi:hypothetical protein
VQITKSVVRLCFNVLLEVFCVETLVHGLGAGQNHVGKTEKIIDALGMFRF